MYESCLEKQQQIIEIFSHLLTDEEKYHLIIEWGREQKTLEAKYKTSDNLVSGCQSQVYLHTYWLADKLVFETESDALISAGLASLLTKVYSNETPEVILKCPATYLDQIGISTSLTPNRANGLYSIHLRMKQDALKLLLEKEKQLKQI